jgi:4-hydroxy-L-threonine phosphate dehydrogenase PdxA
MTLPRIGITLGDPGGVGPEVILKAFFSINSLPKAHYIILGSRAILEHEQKVLNLGFDLPRLTDFKDISQQELSLYEVEGSAHSTEKGKPSKESGETSFRCFDIAVKKAQSGNLQAIVTAPVSKHSWNLAGIHWAGHTDYLNHLYPEAIMFFWSEVIKVALYTHHLPLREALERVKEEPLFEFFRRLWNELKKTPLSEPELLVAGLNPHAGEEGLWAKRKARKSFLPLQMPGRKASPSAVPILPIQCFAKS